MSDSFTAVEYAVLAHLKLEGKCTIPAIAADLLLRPSEVEMVVSDLVVKKLLHQEGDFYCPGDACLDVPVYQIKNGGTRRIEQSPPTAKTPARSPMTMPDVQNVFKAARERASREKAGGL